MKYFILDERDNKVEVALKESTSKEMIFEPVKLTTYISTEDFVEDVLTLATNADISFKKAINLVHISLDSSHPYWVFDKPFTNEECTEFLEVANACIDRALTESEINSPFFVNKLNTIEDARLALHNMSNIW
jgi:predicted nucleic acid-binding protein